ncbi:bile acid:sodium symporter family protein [Novosphingobium aquimarinum]|uniref:bile acid:sodium symporter family protein n=1 Tax=Novosphingobium aquimarinum TaxID=2682494 RepID=UPI0012ECA53A|nr:bile acid:sodium symporter family protein [Novosphingobium aquimarinum]
MRGPSIKSFIDPFLLWLFSVVVLASLFPVSGAAADAFDLLADLAIAFLFFLHGAKLSRAAIMQGIGNWRLHVLALASTYVLFPMTGLAAQPILAPFTNPLLISGLLFLTLLPSTVQSSVAFTSIARGNVAAAVCSASLSNLLGIFLTPVLVGVFMHSAEGGQGFDWGAVRSIMMQLLLPFLAGHFLRPLIGGFVDRNKKILMPVDRASILLVVFSAFSAAVVNGIWKVLDIADLGLLLLASAVILAIVMGVNVLAARLAKLSREDSIVLLFCGSKKSLVSGVPMAGALFAPDQVGMIVLPLMIFHQLQLFVCAMLANRYARDPIEEPSDAAAQVPQTPEEIAVAAKAQALTVPEACSEGVANNLTLLAGHTERMREDKA